MGQVWEGTSPRWAGAPPHKGPRRPGFGEGAPHLTWGASFPSPPLAATQMGSGAAATPGKGTLEGEQPPPLPLYILEGFGAANR